MESCVQLDIMHSFAEELRTISSTMKSISKLRSFNVNWGAAMMVPKLLRQLFRIHNFFSLSISHLILILNLDSVFGYLTSYLTAWSRNQQKLTVQHCSSLE